ncbi:MAG: acyl-CoA dehydrogenase family protein, partial [Steroidobacteraceae bacterium]
MQFEGSAQARDLAQRVRRFMEEEVYPAEPIYYEQEANTSNRWTWQPILRELRAKAKAQGLWIFPMDRELGGLGFSLVDYAPLAEIMSTSPIGTEVFNCYTGTIWYTKLIHSFASQRVKDQFLYRLVNGHIRAAINITEPDVPGSDPTDLKFTARREGNEYVLSGRKVWATGSMMKECEATLVLVRTNEDAPRHARHSLILVPRDTPGVVVEGYDTCFGYDHAPYGHARMRFDDVRVPADNLLGKEGEGFAMMQANMGIGRIAIAMGSIGAAERALHEMCKWGDERVISGQKLSERGVFMDAVARSRMEVEAVRAHVMRTAWLIDTYGTKAARSEVAQCKVLAPNMALEVLDRAIQFHGGAGVAHSKPLAEMYAYQRVS